jgi:hypothetical protein
MQRETGIFYDASYRKYPGNIKSLVLSAMTSDHHGFNV